MRSKLFPYLRMDKEHFRFYIKVRTALHIEPIVIYNELYTVFVDEVPLLRTVQRWSKRFREGREEVEDEERPGRPITETTSENIEQVRDLIKDDPYATIDELEARSGLSHGTVQRIVSDHLQFKKVTARYVVKHLTNSQKAERQIDRKSSNAAWVAREDPAPTVVRRSRFAPGTLLSIFFKSTGPVLIHSVKRGQTIDRQYYINNCLKPVIDEIKNQRPSVGTRTIKLHHDN
ncbi:unnamed protein product [Rotaria sordida]|uniref:Transposase n=1 Tax=Rotaria sordida TaxID=392033 RepID=A0A813ZW91_9BILA|nr:unnamed protein product [Rotaria sordida]CAF1098305.1 unnamed protein product [Rotaria sordida]CAF3603659.1 unnamed protein product [Rotaria sordida]CAF3809434.1 unnamed protein product [Rotaria sordida]